MNTGWTPGAAWTLDALQKLLRLTPDQYDDPRHAGRLDQLDFLRQVGPASPPFFLSNMTPDHPLTEALGINAAIHHPVFGRALRAKLEKAGVPCVHRMREDHPGLGEEALSHRLADEMADFLQRFLPG